HRVGARCRGLGNGRSFRGRDCIRIFQVLSYMSKLLIAIVLLAPGRLVSADNQWTLQTSTLTYQVSHPMHHVEGASHAAKGKGVCGTEECNFLVAVPVKSFDSGDSNRDLHML